MSNKQTTLNILNFSKLSVQQNKALFKLIVLLFFVLVLVNLNLVTFLSFSHLFLGGVIFIFSFFIYFKNVNKLFTASLNKKTELTLIEYEQFVHFYRAVRKSWLSKVIRWFIGLNIIFISVFMLDVDLATISLIQVLSSVFLALCLSSIAFSFPCPAKMLDLDKKKV